MRARLAGAWLLVTICACNVVGEPVVDHRVPATGGPPGVTCVEPPSCESALRRPRIEAPLREARLGEASRCASPLPCATFEGGPELSPEDRAAAGQGAEQCSPTWTANALAELAARSRSIEVSCAQARILAAGEDTESFVRLEGAVIADADLAIESSTPFTLVLADAELRNARVHLHGPVTLRLEDSRVVESLQLSADARARLRPRLEVERVHAIDLLVGTPDAPFLGSVEVARSSLEVSQLVADAVRLESTALARVAVDVLELNAADVQLEDSVMAVEHGSLAASIVRRSELIACDAFSVLGGDVRESRLGPCDTLLRIYDSELVDMIADGPIESDFSLWTMSVLGAHAPTDVVSWGGTASSISACASARSVQLGNGSSIRCSDCDEAALQPEGAVCSIPPLPASVRAGYCPQLDLEEVPTCVTPWPQRARPIDL